MKRFIVDRIEGNKAVLSCENGDQACFDRKSLPKNIKEGDILDFEGGSCYLNVEETLARSQKLKALMRSLMDVEDDKQ